MPALACTARRSLHHSPDHICQLTAWTGQILQARALLVVWHYLKVSLRVGRVVAGPPVMVSRTPCSSSVWVTSSACLIDTLKRLCVLQPMVGEVLICGAMLAGSLLTVTVIAPWIALLFIPITPAYEWVRRRFVVTAREVKRLDSLAASPIFSHFGETLQVWPSCPHNHANVENRCSWCALLQHELQYWQMTSP